MKNRIIVFLFTICAIATLSFSFVSRNNAAGLSPQVAPEKTAVVEGPAGGFVLGDHLEK